MKKEEYEMIQDFLTAQAEMLTQLDLDGFIAANRRADSLGAVMDPTLYRDAHRMLDAIGVLADRAKAYANAYRALDAEKVATE